MSLDRSLNFNSAVEEAPMSSGNYSISYFCLPTSAYTPPKCFFNHTSSLQALYFGINVSIFSGNVSACADGSLFSSIGSEPQYASTIVFTHRHNPLLQNISHTGIHLSFENSSIIHEGSAAKTFTHHHCFAFPNKHLQCDLIAPVSTLFTKNKPDGMLMYLSRP
eukprot:scaffold240786_cov15-Tisochrysis_lutea.AAC.1